MSNALKNLAESDLHQAIKSLRPILIWFVCLAHLPYINGYFNSEHDHYNQLFTLYAVLIKDFFARGAVPILSVISGYLAFQSFQRRYNYKNFINGKVKRLLLPFLLWNIITLVIYALIYLIQGRDFGGVSNIQSAYDILKAVLGFLRLPINSPTYFLRDLFMIMLALPLIHLICQRKYCFFVFLISFIVFSWGHSGVIIPIEAPDIYIPLTFRWDTIIFFSFGYFVARHKIPIYATSIFNDVSMLFLIFVIGVLMSMSLSAFHPSPYDYIIWRAFFGVLFCLLIPTILNTLIRMKETNLCQILEWLSQYSFTLFLSHILTTKIFIVMTRQTLQWQISENSRIIEQVIYSIFYLIFVTACAIFIRQAWLRVQRKPQTQFA